MDLNIKYVLEFQSWIDCVVAKFACATLETMDIEIRQQLQRQMF